MKVYLYVCLILICTLPLLLSVMPADKESFTAEIPPAFELFSEEVNIYANDEFVFLETKGIPDHASPYYPKGHALYEAYNGNNPRFRRNPNSIREQNLTFRIPRRPKKSSYHPETRLGPIGIAINGVPLFNQFAGPGRSLSYEINSFDQYNGHPQRTGQYHYHIEPLAITATEGRSTLIGFLLDGFPVYGPEENGATVESEKLDDFHGHEHPTQEYPEGIYHYHITADDPYINGGQYYGKPGWVTR